MQVADRFGLDRLKRLCELEMQVAINIDTAAHILYTADQHNAEVFFIGCCIYNCYHYCTYCSNRFCIFIFCVKLTLL